MLKQKLAMSLPYLASLTFKIILPTVNYFSLRSDQLLSLSCRCWYILVFYNGVIFIFSQSVLALIATTLGSDSMVYFDSVANGVALLSNSLRSVQTHKQTNTYARHGGVP